jgi:hypothetical protein
MEGRDGERRMEGERRGERKGERGREGEGGEGMAADASTPA